MYERDAALRTCPCQKGGTSSVCPPAADATLCRLRSVDGGIGTAVDHGTVKTPVDVVIGSRIREVEAVDVVIVERRPEATSVGKRPDRTAELAFTARYKRPFWCHGCHVRKWGVVPVRPRYLALLEWDGPVYGKRRVREAHEGVGLLEFGGPMRIDQVRVARCVLERLEGVPDPARDEDRACRIQRGREDPAERGASLPQVDPGTKDRSSGNGNELVPWLGMDAARHTTPGVERYVVLDPAQVRQAKGDHLLTLPVLLEPSSTVTVHGKPKQLESGNARLLDGKLAPEVHHHSFG